MESGEKPSIPFGKLLFPFNRFITNDTAVDPFAFRYVIP